jgi:rhodanese-related sulfurtransferase
MKKIISSLTRAPRALAITLALTLTVSALARAQAPATTPAAAAAAPKTAADCSNDSNYTEITQTELTQLIEAKQAFVVDVNSKESFATKHIPTAIHFGSNSKTFAQALPKDKNALIVAYCGGPMCSAWKQAAEAACKLGYTQVKHFKPGISGWKGTKS